MFYRVPTDPGKSQKVMEFWRTIVQAWKFMENSKGDENHGKSWKMMIMSWKFYSCTEKFCSCNVIILLAVFSGFTY